MKTLQERSSFLKKRTKKLLLVWGNAGFRGNAIEESKFFCFFFFQKKKFLPLDFL